MKSSHALYLVAAIWLLLGAIYYPKWLKPWSEATISWDVSGYYHYLPATFIYHDLKHQDWMNGINEKYLPSPAYDQAFDHAPSGHKVNKYAIGQAVLYSPFFLAAHAYATWSGSYPADGYSRPYQVSIWLGSLLISILGLWCLRKILLLYFEDQTVMWTLLALGLGTHWMEYASITNGMNHTWLFTLLCLLILSTIRFYKHADWKATLGVGFSLGLAILTRPTEIIWVLIPLLWGMGHIRERFLYIKTHWLKVISIIILCGVILSIQVIYWKYVSGEWIVYSYGDQGFNWLHPKIWRGLMGVNIGWWIYTPLMLLAMAGWTSLYRKHRNIFWPALMVVGLAIYITLSWAHFEGGGGLGQRNLIQIYPLMAFPLAALIGWMVQSPVTRWLWIGVLAVNVYYNGWWLHQAHKGGFFQAGQMTTPYFYHVVGRLHPDRDLFKLLDTREYFNGTPQAMQSIWQMDFEQDTQFCSAPWPSGGKAACLNAQSQFIGPFQLPLTADCNPWLRLEADFLIQTHEWDVWKYAQWIVQFYQGETVIKTNLIRVQRLLPVDQVATHVFFDVRLPDAPYDRCTMTLWNGGSTQTLLMDNLKVGCFKEQ